MKLVYLIQTLREISEITVYIYIYNFKNAKSKSKITKTNNQLTNDSPIFKMNLYKCHHKMMCHFE